MSSLYKALVGLFSAGLLFGLGMWLGLTVISPPHGEHGARPRGGRAARRSDAVRCRNASPCRTTESLAKRWRPIRRPTASSRRCIRRSRVRRSRRSTPPSGRLRLSSRNDRRCFARTTTACHQRPVETTGSASAEPQRPQSNPAPTPSTAPAPAQDTRKSEPQIRAASLSSAESANRCDVRACASAYKSFRESDCTYQPFSGPRQLCVSPPAAQRQANESSAYRARAQRRRARITPTSTARCARWKG